MLVRYIIFFRFGRETDYNSSLSGLFKGNVSVFMDDSREIGSDYHANILF